MSRLTQDGTAEPISRDQILRRKWEQGKFSFPLQLTTSRIGNLTWLIPTLAISVKYCEATLIDLVDEPKKSLYGRETNRDLRSDCRYVA